MTAVMVAPAPIDALVSIESIRVVGRHRSQLGDVQALASSIEDLGLLLNPVIITEDSRLISGQRRLEACRLLGWESIPVRIARSVDDAATLLRVERDENTCRKDMLPSEKASLGAAIAEIESERAKERQRAHGGTAPGRPGNTCGDVATSVARDSGHRTREAVGEALGMPARTYSELSFAHRLATDPDVPEAERNLARQALADMDRSNTIYPPAEWLRGQLAAKREAQEAKAAALADPDPAPGEEGRRLGTAAERYARMRELAATAHTSGQIAEILGYSGADGVRQIARDQGIAIPADAVMGRSRKSIDSNRVVRETVTAIEDLVSGLDLATVDELDASQIGHWADSLNASIRTLNRLIKQMKGKAQ
jgi:hypothetical protein